MKYGTMILVVSILFVGGLTLSWKLFDEKKSNQTPKTVLSFEDCVTAGYPILESNPRQCKTSDGRTYTEELPESITYTNTSKDIITVDLPYPEAVTGKIFSVTGKARGEWFFEASFPIEILDEGGRSLVRTHAQAEGEWMTENFVPFKGDVVIPATYTGKATIILKKDNPSGMIEKEAYLAFPITIEY